jgi:serine/threonine protein kinase
MICLNCFKEKGERAKCPHCQFDENAPREPYWLGVRSKLKEGRYLLGPVLGDGGFGVTYKGYDNKMSAVVVVKECLLTTSGRVHRAAGDANVKVSSDFADDYHHWLNRFYDEAVCISRVKNHNIVEIIDFFTENNTAYYVMPFLDCVNLQAYCNARGGISQEDLFPIAWQLFCALEATHAEKIVHRDIKPSNVLITKSKKRAILIDFGAARTTFETDKSLSHLGVMTPDYAPIEQYRCDQDQGPWTDIYSLCATFYWCLSGERPVKAFLRMDSSGRDQYIPIEKQIPNIKLAPPFAELINRGLAFDRQNRIQSASAAKALLSKCQISEAGADRSGMILVNPDPANVDRTVAPGLTDDGDERAKRQMERDRLALVAKNADDAAKRMPMTIISVWMAVSSILVGWYLGVGWGIFGVLATFIAWYTSSRVNQKPILPNGKSPALLRQEQHQRTKMQRMGVEIGIIQDGVQTKRFTVNAGDTIVIGRAADIDVENRYLSRKHVSISVAPTGRFTVVDLNTLNGTYKKQDQAEKGNNSDWIKASNDASYTEGIFCLGPYKADNVILHCRTVFVG